MTTPTKQVKVTRGNNLKPQNHTEH